MQPSAAQESIGEFRAARRTPIGAPRSAPIGSGVSSRQGAMLICSASVSPVGYGPVCAGSRYQYCA